MVAAFGSGKGLVTVVTQPGRSATSAAFGYSRGPLTTLAIERSREGHGGGRGIALLKYTDLLLLAIALPVFILTGLPLLGWAGAAVGWSGQRSIQALIEAKASRTEDTKGFFQLMAGSIIGRSWFLVISIMTVGLIQQEAGLAAAVLSAILFTTYLVITLITRETPEAKDQA